MKRSRRTGALLVAALIVLVGSLGLAVWLTESPGDRQARLGPPPDSVITVDVEDRRLTRTIDLVCEAGAPSSLEVPVGVDPRVGDPVVTALPVADGASVAEGEVMLEVSGRPMIAVSGPLPAYRDIRTGDSGPDVAQLESALSRLGLLDDPDDVADPATRAATSALYDSLGYPEPEDPRLVAARYELTPVPSLPAALRPGPLSVGRPVTPGETLAVGGSGVVVRCPVDRATLSELRDAESISIVLPRGRSVAARLGGITRLDESELEDGETAGSVVVLRPAEDVVLDRGALLTAEAVVGRAPARGTVVPLTAVWRDAAGQDVVTVVDGDQLRRVPVAVRFDDGLSVRVDAVEGGLEPGDRVRVGEQLGG